MKLVFGHDELVKQWVQNLIPHATDFGPSTAIGVSSDDDVLMAGVVFNEYQEDYSTIQLSMAAHSPKWAHPAMISGILRYPFEQLGINKVWTATPHKNERAIKFNEGIGFKKEGTLAQHFGPGNHAVICRMFKQDYARRWQTKEFA